MPKAPRSPRERRLDFSCRLAGNFRGVEAEDAASRDETAVYEVWDPEFVIAVFDDLSHAELGGVGGSLDFGALVFGGCEACFSELNRSNSAFVTSEQWTQRR